MSSLDFSPFLIKKQKHTFENGGTKKADENQTNKLCTDVCRLRGDERASERQRSYWRSTKPLVSRVTASEASSDVPDKRPTPPLVSLHVSADAGFRTGWNNLQKQENKSRDAHSPAWRNAHFKIKHIPIRVPTGPDGHFNGTTRAVSAERNNFITINIKKYHIFLIFKSLSDFRRFLPTLDFNSLSWSAGFLQSDTKKFYRFMLDLTWSTSLIHCRQIKKIKMCIHVSLWRPDSECVEVKAAAASTPGSIWTFSLSVTKC